VKLKNEKTGKTKKIKSNSILKPDMMILVKSWMISSPPAGVSASRRDRYVFLKKTYFSGILNVGRISDASIPIYRPEEDVIFGNTRYQVPGTCCSVLVQDIFGVLFASAQYREPKNTAF
jgi:hypothetical protein